MYSEVLHYYVHKKTNPLTQTQGGSATTLIKPKKIPTPTQNMGRGSPSSWVRRCRCLLAIVVVVVVVVIVAVSPCLLSSSSLALLLPVSTPRAVARSGGSWGCCGGGGAGRPCPCLPHRRGCHTVGGAGSCPLFCCRPPPHCCCRCLCACFLPWPHCSLSSPRKQLLVAVVGGAVVVLACPCRSSSCCPPCEQGRAAVVWA
jgi:hypothetical protein